MGLIRSFFLKLGTCLANGLLLKYPLHDLYCPKSSNTQNGGTHLCKLHVRLRESPPHAKQNNFIRYSTSIWSVPKFLYCRYDHGQLGMVIVPYAKSRPASLHVCWPVLWLLAEMLIKFPRQLSSHTSNFRSKCPKNKSTWHSLSLTVLRRVTSNYMKNS